MRIRRRQRVERLDLVIDLRVGVAHYQARLAVTGELLMGLHADRQAPRVEHPFPWRGAEDTLAGIMPVA